MSINLSRGENCVPNVMPSTNGESGQVFGKKTKMTDFEAKWVKMGQQKQLWHPPTLFGCVNLLVIKESGSPYLKSRRSQPYP